MEANKQLLVDIAEAMQWKTADKDHELYESFKDLCDLVITENPEFKAEKGQFYYEPVNKWLQEQRLGTAADMAKKKLEQFRKRKSL